MGRDNFMSRNFIQPMGRLLMGPTFFLSGGRGRVRIFFGGGKGKKYCATCKVIVHCPHGKWTIIFYMRR
jgi:hypothetical protein